MNQVFLLFRPPWLPGHGELDDALQLSFQSVLDHLLDGRPLDRIQGFGLLQLPQDAQVLALHLTVTGFQVGTLQPIRGQQTERKAERFSPQTKKEKHEEK